MESAPHQTHSAHALRARQRFPEKVQTRRWQLHAVPYSTVHCSPAPAVSRYALFCPGPRGRLVVWRAILGRCRVGRQSAGKSRKNHSANAENSATAKSAKLRRRRGKALGTDMSRSFSSGLCALNRAALQCAMPADSNETDPHARRSSASVAPHAGIVRSPRLTRSDDYKGLGGFIIFRK